MASVKSEVLKNKATSPVSAEDKRNNVFCVWVSTQNDEQVLFKVKGNAPFRKVATFWCKRAGKDIDTVRFLSNEGVRVGLDKPIEELQDDENPNDRDGNPAVFVTAFMMQIGGDGTGTGEM